MTNVFNLVCQQSGWESTDDSAVVPQPDGRKQTVYQEVIEDDEGGAKLLKIYTIIGDTTKLGEVRLRAALGINNALRHGALAIRDHRLILIDTFLLDHADQMELRSSVEYLARRADGFERLIYKTDEH